MAVQTTTSNTSNLAAPEMQALSALIQSLLGGGTPAMQQDRATRGQVISDTQQAAAGYSKNAAFSDAQSAMAAQMRQALLKLLPSITRSAEGAGTSQSSMRALLLQQAAQQAADSSAQIGLKTAVDYGGINANLTSVLERLLSGGDPATQALLSALGIAKGAQTRTVTDTETIGTGGLGGITPQVSGGGSYSPPSYGVRDPFAGQGMSSYVGANYANQNTDYGSLGVNDRSFSPSEMSAVDANVIVNRPVYEGVKF